MELRHEMVGDDGVLHVSGEVDVATAPDMFSKALVLAERAGLQRLLLDLGHTSFIDSGAVHALLGLRNHLGDRLVLRNLSHPARRVLELTAVLTLFHVEDGR